MSEAVEYKLRKELVVFVALMEAKLRENDTEKIPWAGFTTDYLFFRLVEEVGELSQALLYRKEGATRDVVAEAVDVANFAMRIADRMRQKKEILKELRVLRDKEAGNE